MKYRIDIYDTHGVYISNEKFSVFESSNHIPIPNVGDIIYAPSGCGPDNNKSKDVKVVKRQFTYTPEDKNGDSSTRVELYCEIISGS